MPCRNATVAGMFVEPDTLMGVFEEVSKMNVHLNILERAWAVRCCSRLSITPRILNADHILSVT